MLLPLVGASPSFCFTLYHTGLHRILGEKCIDLSPELNVASLTSFGQNARLSNRLIQAKQQGDREMAGKGSRNRVTDRKSYEDNYERIFGKSGRKSGAKSGSRK